MRSFVELTIFLHNNGFIKGYLYIGEQAAGWTLSEFYINISLEC